MKRFETGCIRAGRIETELVRRERSLERIVGRGERRNGRFMCRADEKLEKR